MKWGAFTYSQEPEVERLLTALCESVCEIVRRTAPAAQCQALLLIGGYGRGEGGVQPTPTGPRPHNNLDFLLVTNGSNESTERITERVNRELDKVRKAFAIGVDLSAIDARKLRKSPCLVMWYDMRFGHKTLLGDANFVPSLSRFHVERIPSWNVRDLLVNRGTLLLLNRWMTRQFQLSSAHADAAARAETRRKLDLIAVRHLVKATIGYGDTLLYFDGQYHWSYAEKLQRIARCSLANEEFIELYKEAAAFRFIADYDALSGRDIVQWQEQVTHLLAHVHLCCESLRLEKHLVDWEQYPEAASRAALSEQWESPRAWARKLAYLANDWSDQYPGSTWAQWGLRSAGARSRLSLAFPAVAYDVGSLQGWAQQMLAIDEAENLDLLTAYVERWGQIGDTNFRNFASQIADLVDAGGNHRPTDATPVVEVVR